MMPLFKRGFGASSGNMSIQDVLGRRTFDPVTDRASSLPNIDLTAERTVEAPNYTFHDILWLQRTLNRLGRCCGPEDGRFNRQLPLGLRDYALGNGFMPDYILPDDSSITNRIGISSHLSADLQSRELPAVSACPDRAEAGIEILKVWPAKDKAGVAGLFGGTLPPWLWWAAGGVVLAFILGALLYKRKR